MNKNLKPHVLIYWIVWSIFTLILFMVKFFLLYSMDEDLVFIFFMCYAFAVWIPIMILNEYEYRQLMDYLESKYPQVIEKFKNKFDKKFKLAVKHICSNSNDEKLYQLYKNYKGFNIYSNFVFSSFPFIFYLIIFF